MSYIRRRIFEIQFVHPAINDATGANDIPALNHGNASSSSYADGRAELHKWLDRFRGINSAGTKKPAWLAQHGTAKK